MINRKTLYTNILLQVDDLVELSGDAAVYTNIRKGKIEAYIDLLGEMDKKKEDEDCEF